MYATYILLNVVNILFDAWIVFGKCYLFLAVPESFDRALVVLRASFPSADNVMPVCATTHIHPSCSTPILRPLSHHTIEIKYWSQRNPKQMSVDKNKASSTTVQPTYCCSFKNR